MESTGVNKLVTAAEIGNFTLWLRFVVAIYKSLHMIGNLFKAIAKAYQGEIDSTIP